MSGLLSGASSQLGREIKSHALTPDEFARRKKHRDHFPTKVLREPKLFVIGDERDLEAVGSQRVAEGTSDQP